MTQETFYEISDAKLKHHERQQREAVTCARGLANVDGGSLRDVVAKYVTAIVEARNAPDKPGGIWRGKSAPPWHVGPTAPKRWPAELDLEPDTYRPLQSLFNEFYALPDPAAKVAWLQTKEFEIANINLENLVQAWSDPRLRRKWARGWRNVKHSYKHRTGRINAKPAGERPYGLRPYELKWMQTIASIVLAPKVSDDRYSYQRLRDLKAHIHEQARHSGSAFENTGRPPSIEGLCQYIVRDMRDDRAHWVWKEIESHEQRLGHFPSRAYARGIRWLENKGIEQFRQHDQLRWFIDSPPVDADDPRVPDWLKQYKRQVECIRTRGRDSMIAVDEGFQFEEVANTVERRRTKPLRERRKPGRKPISERAMTNAERVRKHRAKMKSKALTPHECNWPGVVEAPPLAPSAAPGTLIANKETTMSDVVEMARYKQRRVLPDLKSKRQYVSVPRESIEKIHDLAAEILRGLRNPAVKVS